MFDKKASTQLPINPYLAKRWSGRAYDPDKCITHDDKIVLAEAARWSPSCFGDEPWRLIFVTNPVMNLYGKRPSTACLKVIRGGPIMHPY